MRWGMLLKRFAIVSDPITAAVVVGGGIGLAGGFMKAKENQDKAYQDKILNAGQANVATASFEAQKGTDLKRAALATTNANGAFETAKTSDTNANDLRVAALGAKNALDKTDIANRTQQSFDSSNLAASSKFGQVAAESAKGNNQLADSAAALAAKGSAGLAAAGQSGVKNSGSSARARGMESAQGQDSLALAKEQLDRGVRDANTGTQSALRLSNDATAQNSRSSLDQANLSYDSGIASSAEAFRSGVATATQQRDAALSSAALVTDSYLPGGDAYNERIAQASYQADKTGIIDGAYERSGDVGSYVGSTLMGGLEGAVSGVSLGNGIQNIQGPKVVTNTVTKLLPAGYRPD